MVESRDSTPREFAPPESGPILARLDRVEKAFPARGGLFGGAGGLVKAVDGVSIEIGDRWSYGLVGESGSGKTTTSRMLLGLERPTGGRVLVGGSDVWALDRRDRRRLRGWVSAVFQDPSSSLDPKMSVGRVVAEPLLAQGGMRRNEVRDAVSGILEEVQLRASDAKRYPHEFSGGQRQRIAIARAMVGRPKLVVLDEPVSSLDVSIRAQIMNLLKAMQARYGISYLLIAHNLAMVRFMSHRVGVMYFGKIVEEADSAELFQAPLHPYSLALISASVPRRPGAKGPEVVLSGEPPSPSKPPSGCPFHPRCPWAFDRCVTEVPAFREVKPGHLVACHLHDAGPQNLITLAPARTSLVPAPASPTPTPAAALREPGDASPPGGTPPRPSGSGLAGCLPATRSRRLRRTPG
jgi:oligopeptide transport system ATP-binding protein